MKIIFISGYPEGFEAVRTEMFLAKPFTPKALVQKIRTVLDCHSGAIASLNSPDKPNIPRRPARC